MFSRPWYFRWTVWTYLTPSRGLRFIFQGFHNFGLHQNCCFVGFLHEQQRAVHPGCNLTLEFAEFWRSKKKNLPKQTTPKPGQTHLFPTFISNLDKLVFSNFHILPFNGKSRGLLANFGSSSQDFTQICQDESMKVEDFFRRKPMPGMWASTKTQRKKYVGRRADVGVWGLRLFFFRDLFWKWGYLSSFKILRSIKSYLDAFWRNSNGALSIPWPTMPLLQCFWLRFGNPSCGNSAISKLLETGLLPTYSYWKSNLGNPVPPKFVHLPWLKSFPWLILIYMETVRGGLNTPSSLHLFLQMWLSAMGALDRNVQGLGFLWGWWLWKKSPGSTTSGSQNLS